MGFKLTIPRSGVVGSPSSVGCFLLSFESWRNAMKPNHWSAEERESVSIGFGSSAFRTTCLLELNKNPVEGFSAGLIDDNDLYRWEVLIIGPPDTLYEGGVFKAHLTFPKDYPLRPPKMKFITEIWHPNVDKNGDVCISILHEPGEDKYGYEKPEERWLPIHTVETIMISVISMLADPNGDSPANVDAAKEWREDRNGEFKRKVARCVRKSQETAFE
ncbi:ubiquitin-conjugating enzyme E2 G1 isoform X1 [Zalophus californianus]|uniref:Ubiquitin-conjugating enzyme E2 G1 n=1 Tax=Zalophus californianus TaxID=9704 RepID=A0A6J2FME9_ZALCA|nr:ubiquitin-conjugating enzyme E2 G1 isoform X1 [Zalophus californianus]XP_027481209.1 ubiquitin-conjugating enzyme E2 G1 isoform X1 [Zalophus californianus]